MDFSTVVKEALAFEGKPSSGDAERELISNALSVIFDGQLSGEVDMSRFYFAGRAVCFTEMNDRFHETQKTATGRLESIRPNHIEWPITAPDSGLG